jgi:YD repeat-containing protein
MTDPTGASVARAYDPAGNPVTGTLRNGATLRQSFNPRWAVTDMALGRPAVRFVYDDQGRLVEATPPEASPASPMRGRPGSH